MMTVLTLEDIQSIIDEKIDESDNLEYKSPELDGNTLRNEYKKEKIPREIAAFANSGGGTFIIGIKSVNKLPAEIVPLNLNESDCSKLKESLYQILSTKIKPPVQGVNIDFIKCGENQYVMVIYIPDSYAAPHAYYSNGNEQIEYLTRFGNITISMSPEMLHSLFLRSYDISEKIDDFSNKRIEIIKNRQSSPTMIVHILPYSMNDRYSSSMDSIEKIRCALYDARLIDNESYNENGLMVTNSRNLIIQMFRNGAIEINYQIFTDGESIAWPKAEFTSFAIIRKLSQLDIMKKPWIIRIYILKSEGLKGSLMKGFDGCLSYYYGALNDNVIQSDDSFYDGTKPISKTVLPMYDSLANAFSIERSMLNNYIDRINWDNARSRIQ